ncbi:MAG: prepilin peptidase [Vicinamibacterales bacterium]
METGIVIAVLATCLAASVSDVRTRRIPNLLTIGVALAGLVFHLVFGGFAGIGNACLGWAVGAALFFPLFALGGMGGGDVKMLAAIGAWVGPAAAAWTALYAAIAGGVLAILVGLFHGYLKTAFVNIWQMLLTWWFAGVRPVPSLTLDDARGPRLAYALPISVGAMVTLWLR